MWPFFCVLFLPQLLLIILVYVIMFTVFYPLYAFVSFFLFGPFGIISGMFMFFQHATIISTCLATAIFTPPIRKIVFDSVLSREGEDELVNQWKLLRRPVKADCEELRNSFHRFCIFSGKVMVFLGSEITFALIGLIPIAGPCLVIIFKAPTKAFCIHTRYFVLKGWDKKQLYNFYYANKSLYFLFGVTAMLLEMIPFLPLFFIFTNTIGVALWTLDLEHEFESVQVDVVDTAKTSSHSAFVTRAELRSQ